MKYVALLRGINVGGNNIIKMADLKAGFEKLGFSNVITYIQSGNVIFESKEKDLKKISAKLEKGLSKRFGYQSRVVVVSEKELVQAVKLAPKGFGTKPAKYRYDVIFLRAPLTAKEAIKTVPVKEGVDQINAGKAVLYFSRVIAQITKSKIGKLVSLPIYQNMTIRNWNTTTKLFKMMESI